MLRTLYRMLRSPWVAVGIIVVFVAFVAGVAFGLPGSDEAAAQEIPHSEPPDLDKLVIPEDVTPIPVTVIREVTGGSAGRMPKSYDEKISSSYAEYKAAPPGRALYFRESDRSDRVVHLPDDVHLRGIIVTSMCAASDCPELPIYVLVNGESTISLDRYGKVIPGFYKETYDPDAFPFLTQGD